MPVDKVAQRRELKMASIIEAAWDLARDNGIQLVTLHALAQRVGMRQPSLYEYFDSKNALYDAMFADGNRALLDRLLALTPETDARAALKVTLHAFTDFATEDPARNSLLFRRIIPGFEPSTESYALAVRALELMTSTMAAVGVTDAGDVDCLVAMVAGLIEAQLSNDPGGDRWTRHLDRLTDLILDAAVPESTTVPANATDQTEQRTPR